ncbi:MAG: ion channel [Candidatus Izemoplasma sp.]
MKLGKGFYLLISIMFYAGAFFYISDTVYNDDDYLASALFAFAAVFSLFVLLLFNVHMLFINFFRLPIKYMIGDMKSEHIKLGRGRHQHKNKLSYGNYHATLSFIFNVILIILIVGTTIRSGVIDTHSIITIITKVITRLVIYLMIFSSWQYLFKILPKVLNKSIDAKNGFILSLSGAVMVIYIMLRLFEIDRFNEVMIFILIIGFIALLGVNLNMIIGEINIFQNLKESNHSSKVTKAVFMIFFSFHIYVMLYASVVAFSIYSWDQETYVFSTDDCFTEVYPTDPNEQPYFTTTCDHEYGDFLYYTVVTVSTLGYGDISPSLESSIAQAWGGFLSIYGFTFFALSIGYVSNIAIEGSGFGKDENDD